MMVLGVLLVGFGLFLILSAVLVGPTQAQIDRGVEFLRVVRADGLNEQEEIEDLLDAVARAGANKGRARIALLRAKQILDREGR